MPKPKREYYLLIIDGDIEPVIAGPPFKTEKQRDQAAREHKKLRGDDDGIFGLDVVHGVPEAFAYSQGFFENKKGFGHHNKN